MPGQDYFELLGLKRLFALTPEEVETNYLRQSREVHPDYHQLGAAAEQRASLELTAALNEAFRTLSDPFRRAEYLLELEGGPSAADHREMSPAFLEEMLDLRTRIEELRGTGDRFSPELKALEQQLQARHDELLEGVAVRFAEYYAALPGRDPRCPVLLREIRELLNSTRYVQGLLRDLRAD